MSKGCAADCVRLSPVTHQMQRSPVTHSRAFLLLSVPCLMAAVTIPEPQMKNSMSLTRHRSKTNSQIKDFAFPLHSQTVKKAYAWKAENASPLLGSVLYSHKKISLHERKQNSRKLKEICSW